MVRQSGPRLATHAGFAAGTIPVGLAPGARARWPPGIGSHSERLQEEALQASSDLAVASNGDDMDTIEHL